MSDADDLHGVGRYEWDRIVRRCRLPSTVKLVACCLSQYADRDGTRVYPGVARLAAVTGLSERSVRGAMATLRETELITRTRKGSSMGRQALTDEHKLTYPTDLAYRLHMLDPEESPASAACDSNCRHPRTPAPAAAVPVPAAAEHRQLTTRTPATDAGTPATDDRNTGTSCTPPTHDHSTYQHIYQRDDQDPNLTTEGERAGFPQAVALNGGRGRR